MQNKSNKIIVILCEGDSEYAYLQELNRFLREEEKNVVFIAMTVGSGHYTDVKRKFLAVKKDNRRSEIEVWVDNDIYDRNERNNKTNYECNKINLKFLFNTHNFEDFLTLHCDEETLQKWLNICQSNSHHTNPMKSKVYEPLIATEIFKSYKKGECPFSPITQTHLNNLFKNNNNNKTFLKSDFASFLEKLVD
jgi:hypothetical protein